jgi:hypothetical protein
VIERKYYQRQLGERFIRDSIDDCWEPWMKIADEIPCARKSRLESTARPACRRPDHFAEVQPRWRIEPLPIRRDSPK